jgi:hypothetical protein
MYRDRGRGVCGPGIIFTGRSTSQNLSFINHFAGETRVCPVHWTATAEGRRASAAENLICRRPVQQSHFFSGHYLGEP